MARFDFLRRTLRAELEPYPGRMSGTLQDTLSMLLALVFAITLRVPGISLALALILLLQRESPGITFRNVLQIFGGAATASAVCLFWVQLTDGTEVFRFLGFVFGVFLAGFCMASTRFPLFFTMFGFYGFVDLAGWDAHRSPNAIVTGMLSNMASLGLALGAAGIVSFLFGSRHPGEDLSEELRRRLRLLAEFHRELALPASRKQMSDLHHRVVQYAHAGNMRLNQLYAELRADDPKSVPPGVQFRIGLITRVLERSSAAGFVSGTECSAHLGVAELCEYILDPSKPRPQALGPHAGKQMQDIFSELSHYETAAEEGESEPIAEKPARDASFHLFHSDAFTSPDAAVYSLKLTLCATVCYLLYNAVAWPGILTCVVTVLFTGLSSTGAMKQKQLYRITGAAIGGIIAILVESFLFPNMDSITSLVVVSGLVCLASAWVSRSPHISYVGVQIAFAFFLTDLAGFSAVSQIAPARDRVFGVALGILIMWFVFDQLWPTRPSQALEAIRDRVQRNAIRIAEPPSLGAIAAMRAEVSADLAEMQMLIRSAWFDFGPGQHRELARTRRLTRQTEAAAATFYAHLHRPLRDSFETHSQYWEQ